MRMLANNILIHPERPIEQRIGTIVLPSRAEKEFARGTVEKIGPGLWLHNGDRPPIEVNAGDRVLYFKANAVPVVVAGQEMHVVQERELLAILDPGDFTEKEETDATGN